MGGAGARGPHAVRFLVLESAQAGLSWATILKRREGYRKAFAGFDPDRVSRFRRPRIEGLLQNPAIIRNRAKVEAAVNNAKRFLEVQQEFGSFSTYIWGFVGGSPRVSRWERDDEVPTTSGESSALAERHEGARVPVRWEHDPLRSHAGHRTRERPPGLVFSAPGGLAAGGETQAAFGQRSIPAKQR